MTPTKIISAGQEVLTSGSFITYNKEDCKVSFDHNGSTHSITIQFNEDKGTPNPETTYRMIDGGLMVIFTNFESAIGTGNIEPHTIGELGGRPLSWRYQAYNLNQSNSHLVHFTFYLGGL